jgi:catechol 2,3-dioxygenase-like lactoylglutathione lyase family enzyme
MTQEHPMMVGAATVFVVSNLTKSIEYYRDALGFTVTFQYETQHSMHACAVTKLLCTCSRRTRPSAYRVMAAFVYS